MCVCVCVCVCDVLCLLHSLALCSAVFHTLAAGKIDEVEHATYVLACMWIACVCVCV